jgi:hypothetical protein
VEQTVSKIAALALVVALSALSATRVFGDDTPPAGRPPTSSTKPTGAGKAGGGGRKEVAATEHFRSLMNAHIKAALRYMVTEVGEYDRYYTRFLSFYDIDDVGGLRHAVKLSNWWNNQMSFDEYHHLLRPVPATGFRLFALDLRDYRWNSPAWYAVARREPRFRQPWVYFREAEELRREAGYYGVKPDPEDGTTPAVVVVSGVWFLRDTFETQRSTSYYDLLFACRRFVVDPEAQYELKFITYREQDWPGGVDPEDGHHYEAGVYRVKTTHYRKVPDWKAYDLTDFPKDEQDLEKAVGIDVVKAFARKEQIDVDNGAIVAGGRDDPQNGSIVALQNRLVAILDGPLGPYMKSFDTERTAGIKDYSQSLIFAGRPFRRGVGARAVTDAGMVLFYLKNGGQGGILINGEGKRIEVAGANVANDTSDRRLNAGVRNFESCATCHAGGGGFLAPDDLYAKWKAAGIKLKFSDREQRNRVEGFFSGLKDRMAGAVKRYETLANETTKPWADEAADAKPWSGADVAAEVIDFRNRYDDMVDASTAAREMGIPLAAFKWLARRVGVDAPDEEGLVVRRNQRAAELVQGLKIPRTAWDDDLFRQVGLQLDAHAGDPDFKKAFDTVVVPVPVPEGE